MTTFSWWLWYSVHLWHPWRWYRFLHNWYPCLCMQVLWRLDLHLALLFCFWILEKDTRKFLECHYHTIIVYCDWFIFVLFFIALIRSMAAAIASLCGDICGMFPLFFKNLFCDPLCSYFWDVYVVASIVRRNCPYITSIDSMEVPCFRVVRFLMYYYLCSWRGNKILVLLKCYIEYFLCLYLRVDIGWA